MQRDAWKWREKYEPDYEVSVVAVTRVEFFPFNQQEASE